MGEILRPPPNIFDDDQEKRLQYALEDLIGSAMKYGLFGEPFRQHQERLQEVILKNAYIRALECFRDINCDPLSNAAIAYPLRYRARQVMDHLDMEKLLKHKPLMSPYPPFNEEEAQRVLNLNFEFNVRDGAVELISRKRRRECTGPVTQEAIEQAAEMFRSQAFFGLLLRKPHNPMEDFELREVCPIETLKEIEHEHGKEIRVIISTLGAINESGAIFAAWIRRFIQSPEEKWYARRLRWIVKTSNLKVDGAKNASGTA